MGISILIPSRPLRPSNACALLSGTVAGHRFHRHHAVRAGCTLGKLDLRLAACRFGVGMLRVNGCLLLHRDVRIAFASLNGDRGYLDLMTDLPRHVEAAWQHERIR